jgi:hypothetical protein
MKKEQLVLNNQNFNERNEMRAASPKHTNWTDKSTVHSTESEVIKTCPKKNFQSELPRTDEHLSILKFMKQRIAKPWSPNATKRVCP